MNFCKVAGTFSIITVYPQNTSQLEKTFQYNKNPVNLFKVNDENTKKKSKVNSKQS